jgi:hypothetical protein
MPTAYANLAPYLLAGYPRDHKDLASEGTSYLYRAATATLTANRPLVGAIWADGRPVISSSIASLDITDAYGDLTVESGYSYSTDAGAGPTLVEAIYELQWLECDRPIRQHPVFMPGGTYALTANNAMEVELWEAEPDLSAKNLYKYYVRDADGNIVSGPTGISGYSIPLVAQLVMGNTSWADYYPVWTKQSTYNGTALPGVGDIGLKVTPPGSGYPSGYEWRKNDDRATRVGNRAQWQRFESWIGCKTVLVDRTAIYITTPPT